MTVSHCHSGIWIYNFSNWNNFLVHVITKYHTPFSEFSCMQWEKTLESLLDCKEIQPAHSKGDRSWVFFGRNDAKAETPVLWPPHTKSWLIGKVWCCERVKSRREAGSRGWDVRSTTNSMDMNPFKLPEVVEDRGAWHAVVHEVAKSQS